MFDCVLYGIIYLIIWLNVVDFLPFWFIFYIKLMFALLIAYPNCWETLCRTADGRASDRCDRWRKGKIYACWRSWGFSRDLWQTPSMLWLWDWMVFVSILQTTVSPPIPISPLWWLSFLLQFSFGICVPVDVVLWHISLLWKLLPEGSKGAGRPCRCCNWGKLSLKIIILWLVKQQESESELHLGDDNQILITFFLCHWPDMLNSYIYSILFWGH